MFGLKNKHSWSQYRYTQPNSTKPYKLWIRGHDKIYETETGFLAADENGPVESESKTFEDAEKKLDMRKVD